MNFKLNKINKHYITFNQVFFLRQIKNTKPQENRAAGLNRRYRGLKTKERKFQFLSNYANVDIFLIDKAITTKSLILLSLVSKTNCD